MQNFERVDKRSGRTASDKSFCAVGPQPKVAVSSGGGSGLSVCRLRDSHRLGTESFADSALEETVRSELVSLSEFPVSRELTGNLRRFGSPSAEIAPDNRAISVPYEAIPYAPEQGIYFGITGN